MVRNLDKEAKRKVKDFYDSMIGGETLESKKVLALISIAESLIVLSEKIGKRLP